MARNTIHLFVRWEIGPSQYDVGDVSETKAETFLLGTVKEKDILLKRKGSVVVSRIRKKRYGHSCQAFGEKMIWMTMFSFRSNRGARKTEWWVKHSLCIVKSAVQIPSTYANTR